MVASLNEKQQSWIDDYKLIENPLERLNALVDRSKRVPALPESAKIEPNRVEGCVSQVWVIGRLDEASHCVFEAEADSVLVLGLVRALCEFYSGHSPEEVIAATACLWEDLGLDRQLSPTRLNGLNHARQHIQRLARAMLEA